MKKRKSFGFLLLVEGILNLSILHAQGLGDVNEDGTISILDALMIAQYAVGRDVGEFSVAAADVNGDGQIGVLDSLIVAQYAVCILDCTVPLEVLFAGTPENDNIFIGARNYVDPTWAALARAGGGEAVADIGSAVWLPSIASLSEGPGVREHLDNALHQDANMIMFVLYNIPYRNCTEIVSSSLDYPPQSPSPLEIYKNQYIDYLAALFANPAYRKLRIVCIIEPRALADLITNSHVPLCREAAGPGGYVDAIQYALNAFTPLPHVYSYLDLSHSGLMGWDSNFGAYAALLTQVVQGTRAGMGSVSGFISNVALYSPLKEPYLPDPEFKIDGLPLKASDFYEWNGYFGELDYAGDMRGELIRRGFPANMGILIDTSRNGWGGPMRPTAPGTSTDLNTYVEESKIDRRQHRGNWCNQAGGIGERPRVNPVTGIQAYVWAKAPGLSDGISDPGALEPNSVFPFYGMCASGGPEPYYSYMETSGIQAPAFGEWNQTHFEILLQNAYPPL